MHVYLGNYILRTSADTVDARGRGPADTCYCSRFDGRSSCVGLTERCKYCSLSASAGEQNREGEKVR